MSDGQPARADIEPEELADLIAGYALDKKAVDVTILDLRSVAGYTDFFVIASGGSDRQTKAIHDGVAEGLKREHGLLPRRVEGVQEARWILADAYRDRRAAKATPREESRTITDSTHALGMNRTARRFEVEAAHGNLAALQALRPDQALRPCNQWRGTRAPITAFVQLPIRRCYPVNPRLFGVRSARMNCLARL